MSLSPTPPEGPVAFVYAGPESSVGDAADLLLDTAFAAVLDECAAAYREVTGANLRGRLSYPDPDWPADIAQPVLVSLQLAMTAALAAHGVTPAHVFGHGTGELSALVAAGALDAREAMRLVSLRARLMQEYGAPAGAVEVRATAAEAEALCARVPGIETAAVDGPDRRVLAGPEDAVTALIELCEGTGVRTRRLPATRAFHTSLADPVLRELDEELAGMRFRPTRLPVTSGVDGLTRPPGWLPDAVHLREQARMPIRFDLALGALLGSGCRTLIQVGPEGVRANAGGEASSGAALLTGEVETGRVGARWHAAGNLYYAGVSIAPPAEPQPTPRTATVTTTAPPRPRATTPDPVVGRHRARAAEQERILRALSAAGPLDVSVSLPDASYARVLEVARFAEEHGLRGLWLAGPVPAAAIAAHAKRTLLGLDSGTAAERAVTDDASDGRVAFALHAPYTVPDERWRGRALAVAADDAEAAEAARLGLDAIVDAPGPAAAYRSVRADGRVAVRIPLDVAADVLAEVRESGGDEVILVLGAEPPVHIEALEAPDTAGEIEGFAEPDTGDTVSVAHRYETPAPTTIAAEDVFADTGITTADVSAPEVPDPDVGPPAPSTADPVDAAPMPDAPAPVADGDPDVDAAFIAALTPEPEPEAEADSPTAEEEAVEPFPDEEAPTPDPVHAPLSPAQALIWPHRADGNLVRAVQFDGPLTVSALTAALRAVVARHEPLRTMYTDVTGHPLQVVLPRVDLEVPVADLTGYHEDTAVRHALATAASAPLDKAAGKAASFQLLRFSYTRHVLICAFHPLTVDPWSYQVLAAELAELYRAALDGEAAPLPAAVPYSALPVPSPSRETTDFWAELLEVAPEPLDLPSDRVRPAEPGPGTGSVNLEVPSALAERIRALAADAGVTVPTVLLTAFAAALHGLSGRADVVVGAEVPGVEALVGPLSRLLPIRLDMSGDPAFTLLLASARDATAAVREHAAGVPHVPSLAATIEFDGGLLEPALTGVRTTVLDFPPDPLRTDLRLRVWQRDGLRWRLDYRTEVFGEEVAQNVLGAVLDVLVAAVATPAAPLTEILGLGEPLTPAVTGPVMPPSTDSVHALFELQAAATPEAIAVVCGDETWTYRELRDRAATLARLLHRHGTGAGDLVAVLIPRRPDLIAAQLAVLRLGAAFLPLDPARPLDELTGLAAGARMVLAARHAPDLGVAVVHVEDDPGETDEPPTPPSDPERIAYHVRTTVPGRTVAVSHRALVNMVRWGMTTLGLASGDAVAHMLDLDLDVNLAEIYPALLAGAAVHMVPGELRDDELELTIWWTLKRITVACLPAPLAERVFGRPLPDGNRLRFLLVGGRKVKRRPPISFPTVFSLYGVPENAIVAALSILAQEGEDAADIGLPVDNNRLYIVDRHGGPARPGVPGELWIGGAGVASGYPHDPEATAAAFRPGPDGTPLFRTGDQVRMRGDGALEYCGPVPAWAAGERRSS